ncbi:SUZ RNA-binding domain-containing-like [Glandiceps talaboti]
MADDEDEEVWDSWEDAVDSGAFDKKIEESKKDTPDIQPNNPPSVLLEDTTRTAYQPQLKILKRQDVGDNAEEKQKQLENKQTPHKTLEQREKEYAEARERIFGAAESEDQQRPSHLIPTREDSLQDSVIRQPRGPDGTTGFQLTR